MEIVDDDVDCSDAIEGDDEGPKDRTQAKVSSATMASSPVTKSP